MVTHEVECECLEVRDWALMTELSQNLPLGTDFLLEGASR